MGKAEIEEIELKEIELKENQVQPGNVAEWIRRETGLQVQNIRSYSPLALAYIGDSIYDLIIRTILIEEGNAPVNTLHRRASSVVKAEAQREAFYRIEAELTEEEGSVFRRGRNAKSYTMAKNASVTDYRIATGLEALMGYLYLTGQMTRLLYLVRRGIDSVLLSLPLCKENGERETI